MANQNLITTLINGGVIGLSALFGSHSSSSANASLPIAMLKGFLANPVANADAIKAQASLLALEFSSTNPDAAATSAALAANPQELPVLLPVLISEVQAQQGNILQSLAGAVAATGKTLSLSPGGITFG